jgi:hypothetical protein
LLWSISKHTGGDVTQVPDEGESARRIAETVLSLPKDTVPIVAAHNGPTGLGRDAWSICGVDFRPCAGAPTSMVLSLQNPSCKPVEDSANYDVASGNKNEYFQKRDCNA